MLFSPPLVASTAQTGPGLTIKAGIGRVERQIDAATYVIAVGKEKITLTVPAGSLTAGEQVFISVRADGLFIERLDTAGSPLPAGNDSFFRLGAATQGALDRALESIITLLSEGKGDPAYVRQSIALFAAIAANCSSVNPQLTEEIAAALDTLVRSDMESYDPTLAAALIQKLKDEIPPDSGAASDVRLWLVRQTPPAGIFAFSTVAEAVRFLNGDESLASDLTALDREKIILKTTVCNDQQSFVALLEPDEVRRELAAWNTSSQSKLFQSLPMPVVHQLLLSRGSIPLERLRLLDAFAASLQIPAATEKIRNADTLGASLGIWLDAASDGRGAPSALAARAPVYSVTSIVDVLDEIGNAKNIVPAQQQILFPKFPGITDAMVQNSTDRPRLIPALFSELGFDLEQTLSLGTAPEKTGLKQLLMRLLHAIDEPAPSIPPATARESPAREEVTRIMNSLEQTISSSIYKVFLKVNGDAEQTSVLAVVQERLQPPLVALREKIDGLLADALLLKVPARARENAVGAAVAPEVVETFIRDAAARLATVLRPLAAAVEQALRQLPPAILPNLSDNASLLAGPAAVPQMLSEAISKDLEVMRERLIRAIEAFMRETIPSDHTRRSIMTADDDGTLKRESPKLAQEPLPFDRALVRQTVEQLINRVESLQLLARQTPTASGDQQILALPIKIGEEWTEMQVRFIRKRTGKTGGDRRHYTVYVNVAPVLLGAISARLDYQDKQSLSLSMEFENPSTHRWFYEHKTELRDALIALGVPAPRIEIHRLRPVASATKAKLAAQDTRNAVIDIKA
jgi:hypothetical protein